MCKTISLKVSWGGKEQSGGNPIERGGGHDLEEGGWEGDPRGRNTEKLCLIAKYFAIQKVQRSRSHQRVGMSGIRGYGKWMF